MSEDLKQVKWIKLAVNLFDDEKIKQIKSMPEGYGLIVIWIQLLCLAGRSNADGFIYLTPEIPYTEEMLCTEFGCTPALLKLALSMFQRFGMIEVISDVYHVSNWRRHQSAEKLDDIRAYNREAKRRERERKRALLEGESVNDMSLTIPDNVNLSSVSLNSKESISSSDSEDIKPKKKKEEVETQEPAVISLTLIDGTEHPVTQSDIDKYCTLYPAVDVMQELREMVGWLDANPNRRKTKNGIKRFINNWLSKEQDRGGAYRNGRTPLIPPRRPPSPPAPTGGNPFAQYLEDDQ